MYPHVKGWDKMTKKQLFSLVSILLIFITGCGQATKGESLSLNKDPYSRTEFMMGTVITVKIYDEGKEGALESAFDQIKVLDEQISAEKHASEINKINENAG